MQRLWAMVDLWSVVKGWKLSGHSTGHAQRGRSLGALAMLCASLTGCMDSLDKQVQKDPERGIIGKTTQDVGEFKPAENLPVSDSKIRATDPISAPLQAYGPMVEQLMKTQIAHALMLYNAENGRYPETYDEFMEQIIKRNNIRLPVLPGGMRYQYDVTNHQLVIVGAAAEVAPAGDPAAAEQPAAAEPGAAKDNNTATATGTSAPAAVGLPGGVTLPVAP